MRRIQLALVACALSLSCAGGALAQSVSPSAPTHIVTTHKPVRKKKWLIELMPTLSTSTGGDEFSPVQPPTNPFVEHDFRLSYRFAYQFTPHWSFSYFHNGDIADNTLGRSVTQAGKFVYPQSARDVLDDIGFSYALSAGPVDHGYIRAAYNYEHRVCCPAANNPTNLTPAAWHSVYLEGQYKTTPITPLDLSFSYTERLTRADHHDTEAFLDSLPPGFTGGPPTEYGLTQTLGAQFNIDPKLIAFGTFMWGATYFFDNTPFPYQADTFDYGVMRPITRWFTLRMEANQQTQRPQGYPFLYPNTLHRTRLIVTGDFKIGS